MNIKWYLDRAMGDSTDKVAAALKELKIPYEVLGYISIPEYQLERSGHFNSVENLATFYGTIRFIQYIQRKNISRVITFSNFDKLRWMDYADTIKDYLWNRKTLFDDYRVMPWSEIRRTINPSWRKFIKPERSTKPFEAFVSSYNEGWPHLQISDRELCVVAPEYVPIKEWRCWMVDGFCGGASYSPEIGDPAPYNVLEFANAVHGTLKDKASTPDRAYTIDIGADAKGNLGVIELNSFSCAGIYLNDPQKVIELVRCVNDSIVKVVEKQN